MRHVRPLHLGTPGCVRDVVSAHTNVREPTSVGVFVGLVVSAAGLVLFATRGDVVRAFVDRPIQFGLMLVFVLILQVLSVDVYGKGAISVSGVGLLTVGFALGPGAAMAVAVLAAAVHAAQYRPKLYRAAFNASTFSLAAAAGAATYAFLTRDFDSGFLSVPAALAASGAFTVVNIALLTTAMSLVEGRPPSFVFRERFRWLVPHYIAFGPLAFAAMVAYDRIGPAGLAAFILPPAMMMLVVRQYLDRTRESVEEVRRTNEELRLANSELAERNDDLQEVLAFSQGLASLAHDTDALVAYAESTLVEMFATGVRIVSAVDAAGIGLDAGGKRVAALELREDESFDRERWTRLREVLLPQLATALESSQLVVEVSRRHLATIAALSRSMEAKDGYTGGHVERVSDVAVAIAKRLGYAGPDLDAIEVGALLHDIGKIGIPEQILQKPGPLDQEEWEIMRRHPVISEHILAGCDLSPLVLQAARSSHERMDGNGYPDGLAGEEIPMPARIVLVADAFDALTSDRSYRKGRSAAAALEEIRTYTGSQFCPKVVAALERVNLETPHVLGASSLSAISPREGEASVRAA